VQRAQAPRARQRLLVGGLPPGGHQPGQLVLRQPDLLASELGQLQVGDLEIGLHGGGAHLVSVPAAQAAASSFSCLSCSKRSQSAALTCSGRWGSDRSHVSTASRSAPSDSRRAANAISDSPTPKRSSSSLSV